MNALSKYKFITFLCLLIGLRLSAQDVSVTGTVTADNGTPAAGVSVTVKGTSRGTSTNNAGKYSISVSPTATLVFSAVGFNIREEAVGGRTDINVSLTTSTRELEQVVVVGYGSQRKVDVTGAVASVKGEEISKQASINPISALQGKVAGVQITNSGAPGASPQITIRGVGTVYGSTSPLYVVDGVWYDDVSFLNPADIENISILKDASSEAIYGIRAANGVVLITTRKGTRNGKPTIDYNGFVGFQVVTNQVKMANGSQYATMINELDTINGATPRYKDNTNFGNTDWYRQALRSAMITNHQLSLSGGSEKSTYNFSVGYLKQEGIVEKNTFERYTAKLQNDFNVSNNLKLGYTVTTAYNNSRDIDGGIFHQLYAAAPNVPVYYADGTYGDPNDYKVGNSNSFNPQVTLDFFNQKSKNYRFTGNLYAELKVMKGLSFRTSMGGDYGEGEVRNYSPLYVATLSQRSTESQLTVSRAETRNWLIENTLTYDKTVAGHSFKLLAGQSAQRYNTYGTTSSIRNVPNTSEGDYYIRLGNAATVKTIDNGDINTVASYFGRLNYAFENRYMLTASMRADGSSKFLGDQRWGYFPSVGLGWVISKERFMKDQQIFDNLKLRGSWGKVGNVSVPNQLSVLTVTQQPSYIYVGGNGTTGTGASISTIVPPVTYWERGIGTNIGLEAAFLKNKLTLDIDFYNRKTEKAIFDIPILGSLGTTGDRIVGNQATFQNRGLEIVLGWRDNISKDFTYSINGNVAFNSNKVLEVSTGSNPIYKAVGTTGTSNFNTQTIVGAPIGQFVGLQVMGVFQTDAEIASYKAPNGTILQPNAKPGDFKFQDTNGDGIIDDKDRVVLGNPNPKVIYGLNTNFAYKAFDLTIDVQGVSGVQIYNANSVLRYGTENFSADFFNNRWHGAGTSNTYPSANVGGGQNYRSNSFFVEDGSYVRIRNIQLGYTLPQSLVGKWKINRLRVYANAQNALNFFKYKGFSPEVGGSPTTAGVDLNVYPMYATYNFGVNLTF